MLSYDTQLVLTHYERIAFAASCAERLWPALRQHPGPLTPAQVDIARAALDRAWAAARTGVDAGDKDEVLDPFIPHDDHPDWEPSWAFTQDTLIAIAYAMDSTRTDDARIGEWAARQAYTCADQAAQYQRRDLDLNISGAEAELLAMPVVQVALRGIADDLELASTASTADIAAAMRSGAEAAGPELADLLAQSLPYEMAWRASGAGQS